MKNAIGPYQAVETYLHLGPEGSAIPLEVNETFWEKLTTGGFEHLGPGRLVSTYAFGENWTNWERHPAGEEVAVLIGGSLEMVLETISGERRVPLTRPGQFIIIPRGAWHTADVSENATVLFITPGDGTEHRARE